MPSLRKSTCNYCGIEKAETQRPMELCAWPSALDLCHLFHMIHCCFCCHWTDELTETPQDLRVEENDEEETYSATSLLIVTETRTELTSKFS